MNDTSSDTFLDDPAQSEEVTNAVTDELAYIVSLFASRSAYIIIKKRR